MGTAGPPELARFIEEREFHRELGWTDGIPLGDQPWRKVRDYGLFISLIRREEHAQANRRR